MQEKSLAQPLCSVRPLSTDLLCCIVQRCSCTMPICKCGTRKQPHTNFGVTPKGKSSVKMKNMGLETLHVAHAPLPLTSACMLGELPTAGEGPAAAELQGGQVHGPSSKTISQAVQLSLVSLILSSAACWNHREQSTFYFC